MKRAGVAKARSRLALAHKHLSVVKSARNHAEFEEAWYQLLVAANAIEGILEFSAHNNSRNKPWFGRKKHQIKTDPLLSYMRQARNSDEHGIESVTAVRGGSITLNQPKEGPPRGVVTFKIHSMTEDGIDAEINSSGPNIGSVTITPPHPHLLTVRNEMFGDEFDPPHEHLGAPLQDTSPIGVAEVWLAYFERLIAESEERIAE